MTCHLRLVDDDLPRNETVDLLSDLLDLARAGRVRGLAFVAPLDDGTFIANAAGECFVEAALTRDLLPALDVRLEGISKGIDA